MAEHAGQWLYEERMAYWDGLRLENKSSEPWPIDGWSLRLLWVSTGRGRLSLFGLEWYGERFQQSVWHVCQDWTSNHWIGYSLLCWVFATVVAMVLLKTTSKLVNVVRQIKCTGKQSCPWVAWVVVVKTKPKRSNCLKKVPGWDTVVQCTFLVHAANMEEESPQMQPNHKSGWRKQLYNATNRCYELICFFPQKRLQPWFFLYVLAVYDWLFNEPTLVSRDILDPVVRAVENECTRPFTTVMSCRHMTRVWCVWAAVCAVVPQCVQLFLCNVLTQMTYFWEDFIQEIHLGRERYGMCRYNTVLRGLPIRNRLKHAHCCDDIINGATGLQIFNFSKNFYSNSFFHKIQWKWKIVKSEPL